MKQLKNKVAIITGAAGGMGAVHAKVFIDEGAKVVLTDIMDEEGKKLAKELGSNALFIKQDVTKEEDWKKVVAETERTFGPVDILINNAGIVMTKMIEDTSLTEYQKTIDINQTGTFLGMKLVLPSMKKAGGGSIINISSIEGLVGGAMIASYTASKFAVTGLTKAAAMEFAPYGIRVNSVHPGVIDTPMIHQEDVKEAVKEVINAIPLKRPADPKEVSKMLVFLASDAASYSTGSAFVIDGGLTPF